MLTSFQIGFCCCCCSQYKGRTRVQACSRSNIAVTADTSGAHGSTLGSSGCCGRLAALAQARAHIHQHAGCDIGAPCKLLQARLQQLPGRQAGGEQRGERFRAERPQGLQVLLGCLLTAQARLGL